MGLSTSVVNKAMCFVVRIGFIIDGGMWETPNGVSFYSLYRKYKENA